MLQWEERNKRQTVFHFRWEKHNEWDIKIILCNHNNSLTWMHVSMNTGLSLTNRYRGSNLPFLCSTWQFTGYTYNDTHPIMWYVTKDPVTHNFDPSTHPHLDINSFFLSVGRVHLKHTNPSLSGSSITDSWDSTSPARKCCSLKGTDSSNMLAIFWSWTCVENPELCGREGRTTQNTKQVKRPLIFYHLL